MGITISGPSTKITLSKVSLEASTNDRTVISSNAKGFATPNGVGALKGKRIALSTVTMVTTIMTVGF